MTIDDTDIYLDWGCDLIPVNFYNKMISGAQRGKTPLHNDWQVNNYTHDQITQYKNKGYNLGCRIKDNELVIDIDPRNFDDNIDSLTLLSNLLEYKDFNDVIFSHPTVLTGGGGYHIYFLLPDSADPKLLTEVIDNIPGVEFKKSGRQVLCAGSRHPNGNYYEWFNAGERSELPSDCLDKITVFKKLNDDALQFGRGCLSGQQLQDLVLSKLNVDDFNNNDSWFPILCASHYATDGLGADEFVSWSTSGVGYEGDEFKIRCRWESLYNNKSSLYTTATLIDALNKKNQESKDLKAILTFSSTQSYFDPEDADFEVEDAAKNKDFEASLLEEAESLASSIDVDDVFADKSDLGGEGFENLESGSAVEAAKLLHPDSSDDEVVKCLKLIKLTSIIEATRAKAIMQYLRQLSKSAINEMMKALDDQITIDLARVLSDKTLQNVFKDAKHLTCPPSGILYAFKSTHWVPLSDEFLGKIVQATLNEVKAKLKIKSGEVALLTQAVKLSRISVATLTNRLYRTDLPSPVINCRNGEIWIHRDGSHKLRKHSYKSYLTSCLDVDYDPSAKGELFIKTLNEIFANYSDCQDMIRHMGELLGYTIQPYKNIASWWLFRGPGGDGKSTILKILGALLQSAQLMSVTKILNLGAETSYTHSTNSLVNKLSVIVEELPTDYLLKDSGVKLLSENTKMEANPKHGQPFDFMYCANLIMCSNGYPAIRDLSHGMFRRANVIPFNRQFDKHGLSDLDRAQDIISNPAEMSGVLNFALEGLQRLRDRGRFEPPESCIIAKQNWLGNANNVIRFVNEMIQIDELYADCVVGDLHFLHDVVYQKWCQDNGIDDKHRKKRQHFKNDLENLGLKIVRDYKKRKVVMGGVLKS